MKSLNKKQVTIPRSRIISPVRLQDKAASSPRSSNGVTPDKRQEIVETTPCSKKRTIDMVDHSPLDAGNDDVLATPMSEDANDILQGSSLMSQKISQVC